MAFQLSLSTEKVSAAYPDQPLLVAPETSLAETLELMRAQRSGSVLVCENAKAGQAKLLGIFTDRDALRVMASSKSLARPITEEMSADPLTLKATTTVGEAITMMSQGRYRHLPVLDDHGTPNAMATVQGIVHYLVDHFPQTIYTLPPKTKFAPNAREGA